MGVDGTILPSGSYRLTRAENERLCRAVGADPDPSGRAHPLFYYVATQVGIGISVEGLLALCAFDVADGPLMIGSEAVFASELLVDETYQVEGEIVSLVRKPSRTFGAVDLLSFRLTLRDQAGEARVECVNQWMLPRRGEVTA